MSQPTRRRRIVFAGTPDFAAVVLGHLLDDGQEIVACYCQPDRPAGRGRKLTPPPVKVLAEARGLPVFQPVNFRADEDVEALRALAPDLMIVVAYGLILPQRVLDIPVEACINVHASLLPRWRGAAPLQRAIMAGDAETGVTLMRMEAGLDTGPMLSLSSLPLTGTETASSLHDRLAVMGAETLVAFLHAHPAAIPAGTPQPSEGVTYASKLAKDEAIIDWTAPAPVIDRQIRGLHGWPVAQTLVEGEVLRVWGCERTPASSAHADTPPGTLLDASRKGLVVSTGEDTLTLTHLQLPGGKPLPVSDLLNSRAAWFAPGKRLGVT